MINNHLDNWFGQVLFIQKQATQKYSQGKILKYLKFAVNIYF